MCNVTGMFLKSSRRPSFEFQTELQFPPVFVVRGSGGGLWSECMDVEGEGLDLTSRGSSWLNLHCSWRCLTQLRMRYFFAIWGFSTFGQSLMYRRTAWSSNIKIIGRSVSTVSKKKKVDQYQGPNNNVEATCGLGSTGWGQISLKAKI